MQKYWDTIAVGVITFVIVAIILAIKPGYTPLEVTDEALNPPAAAETMDETADDAASATEEATAESSS